MEVVGTVAAVTGLIGVSTKTVGFLKQLMKDAKVNDSTVEGLCRKLESMQSLLTEMADFLQQIPADLRRQSNLAQLCSILHMTRTNCQDIVDQLRTIFEPLKQRSSSTTPQAIMKSLKLQFKRDEIVKLENSISAYQMTFQTTLNCILVVLAIESHGAQNQFHDKLDRLGDNNAAFELRLTRLQDSLDEMAGFLITLMEDRQQRTVNLNANANESSQTNNQRMIENLQGFRAAAKPILTDASMVMDEMSTISVGQSKSASKRELIVEWNQRTPIGAQAAALQDENVVEPLPDVDLEDLKSVSTSEDFSGAMDSLSSGMSRQRLDIRSRLIQRGIDAYSQSSYEVAMSCFQQALEEGSVGVQDPLLGIMSENALKAWYQLSGVRVRNLPGGLNRTRTSRVDLSRAPAVDLNTLRKTRNLEVCLQACIEASILLYLNLIDQAEETCDTARESILRLRGEKSREYHDAVLLMVEIQYSRGPKEKAKEWCAEVSSERLRERFESFIVGKPGPPKPTIASHGTDVNAVYWLLQAVTCGNFLATLFILQTYNGSALRYHRPDLSQQLVLINEKPRLQGLPERDYLTYASKSWSLATISLLLERHDDLEESSIRFPSHEDLVQQLLFGAICDQKIYVARLLLDYGPGKHATERCPPGLYYKTCYELWPEVFGSVNTNAFEHAIVSGCDEIFHLLLPNAATNGSGVGEHRSEPPLNIAIRCRFGRHLVTPLLKAGADANSPFKHVRPLALAIYHSSRDERLNPADDKTVSRREMVKLLLDAGAEVDRSSIIDGKRVTPLQQAREMRLKHVIELLLEYGATDRQSSIEVPTFKVRRTSRWWKRNP